MTILAEEPVGDVDLGGTVFRGGFLLQYVGKGDGEVGLAGEGFTPGRVGVDVRKDQHFAAPQDIELVAKLGFAAGGEPDELGAEGAADDGGFLGFHQTDEGGGIPGEEMLPEEALPHGPVFRKEALLLEAGVHPVHGDGGILDAVAGLGVVLDDLAGAGAALQVCLIEDGGTVPGDAQAVFPDEGLDGGSVEDAVEESEEVAAGPEADGPGDDVLGEKVHPGCLRVPFLLQPGGGLAPVLTLGPRFGMELEVLRRGEVVAAGGFVVAAAYCFVYEAVVVIDVGREAVRAFTLRTAEAGGLPGVFGKVVAVVHTQSSL